jgi:hypothetical protein
MWAGDEGGDDRNAAHAPPPALGVLPSLRAGQIDLLANAVRRPEGALCPGDRIVRDRCAAAWQALAAVRGWESASEALALRRRLESEADQPHAPTLSELLRKRWQAGDWTVEPDHVLSRLH